MLLQVTKNLANTSDFYPALPQRILSLYKSWLQTSCVTLRRPHALSGPGFPFGGEMKSGLGGFCTPQL